MERTMSHADVMAARDGTVYVVALRGTAKIVRDGVTVARAIAYTDGTFEVSDASGRTSVGTWEAAIAWLTARATAEAITANGFYLVNFLTARAAA